MRTEVASAAFRHNEGVHWLDMLVKPGLAEGGGVHVDVAGNTELLCTKKKCITENHTYFIKQKKLNVHDIKK